MKKLIIVIDILIIVTCTSYAQSVSHDVNSFSGNSNAESIFSAYSKPINYVNAKGDGSFYIVKRVVE